MVPFDPPTGFMKTPYTPHTYTHTHGNSNTSGSICGIKWTRIDLILGLHVIGQLTGNYMTAVIYFCL